MGALLIAVVGAVAVAIALWILPRRLHLPCPARFSWVLENRVMDRVAGSAVVIERAGILKGMHVLDAGCGAGRVALPLARHVGPDGEVVALDLQDAMLAKLTARARDQGLANIRLVRAALGDGALRGERFDRAVMVTVLGEIPDPEGALAEVYGALKPGGVLSVTEVLPDLHFQRRRTVRALGEGAGFRVEEAHSGMRSFTLNLVRPA